MFKSIPCRTCNVPFSPDEITKAWPPNCSRCNERVKFDRFVLMSKSKRGGMGRVYRAYDPKLERVVALKQLLPPNPKRARTPEEVERFIREAKVAAPLGHTNIVKVFETGLAEGKHYIVTNYVEGGTLADEIRRSNPAEQAAPSVTSDAMRRAVAQVRQLAEALEDVHRNGIVHRDVKPSNILLDDQGVAFLADFGIARRRSDSEDAPRPGAAGHDGAGGQVDSLTRAGQVIGTAQYMSPEQAAGKKVGPQSDQYSLGVVLYELICGQLPFDGCSADAIRYRRINEPVPPPRTVNPRVPRDLEAVCLKSLARRPEDRYASCEEFAHDLRSWLDGYPVSVRPPSTWERAWLFARRERILSGVLAFAAVVLLLLAIAMLTSAANERNARLAGLRLILNNMVDRGVSLCEQNEPDEGMLWLARALESSGGDVEAEHGIRLLMAGWRHTLSRLGHTLQLQGEVRGIVVSGDGSTAAVILPDRVELLNTATGERVAAGAVPLGGEMMRPHTDIFPRAVTELVLSHDGRRLISKSRSGPALWEVSGDQLRQVYPKPVAAPAANPALFNRPPQLMPVDPAIGMLPAALSRDGKTFALAHITQDAQMRTASCLVEVVDTDTGRTVGQPVRANAYFTSLDFHPSGERLVASVGRVAQVYDARTGQPVGGPLNHTQSVREARFAPDGRTIITTEADPSMGPFGAGAGNIQVWDADDGKPIRRLPGSGQVAGNGLVAMTLSFSGPRMIDLRTGLVLNQWNGLPIVAAPDALSADGMLTFESKSDRGLRVLDLRSGRPIGQPLATGEKTQKAAFIPGWRRIVTATSHGQVSIWELPTLSSPKAIPGSSVSYGDRASFSADGKKLLALSASRVTSWERTRLSILIATGHTAAVSSPPPSPFPSPSPSSLILDATRDGSRQLVTSGDPAFALPDSTITLVDTKGGKPIFGPVRPGTSALSGAISPDGKRVAVALADQSGARVWDVESGRPAEGVMTHPGGVAAVRFSSDGRTIATVSPPHGQTAEVGVWDAATGKPRFEPLKFPAMVQRFEFGADGRRFLTVVGELGKGSKEARLWDAATGKPVSEPFALTGWSFFSPDQRSPVAVGFQLANHLGKSQGEALFTPGGKLAVIAGADSRLWRIDAATGKCVGEPILVRGQGATLFFTRDQKQLCARTSTDLMFWSLPAFKSVATLPGVISGLAKVATSADGRRVAVYPTPHSPREHRVTLYDLSGEKPAEFTLEHDRAIEHALFSPDGKVLATVGHSYDKKGILRRWDAATGAALGAVPFTGPDGDVVLKEAEGIVWVSNEPTKDAARTRLLDLSTGVVTDMPFRPAGEILDLRWRPNGKAVAFVKHKKAYRLWDVLRNEPVGPEFTSIGVLSTPVLSPDGDMVLVVGKEGSSWRREPDELEVRGTADARVIQSFKVMSSYLGKSAFTPDGKRLVLASKEYAPNHVITTRLSLWDLSSGKKIDAEAFEQSATEPVSFSLDGRVLLTGQDNGKPARWDVETGRPSASDLPLSELGGILATRPDNRHLLLGAGQREVQPWDVKRKRPAGPPLRHGMPVTRAAYSPDGGLIVTDQGSIRFFSATFGKPLGDHYGRVDSLPEFLVPEGRAVVTSSLGGGVALVPWPTPINGDPERIRLWLDVITGKRLDQYGGVVDLTSEAVRQSRERLGKLGGPPT